VNLATASISPDTADYTAHFMARIDTGDDIANRYVKISNTVDRNLALSDLVPEYYDRNAYWPQASLDRARAVWPKSRSGVRPG